MFQPGGPEPYPNIQPGCLENFDFSLAHNDATSEGEGEGVWGGGREGGGYSIIHLDQRENQI